MSYLKPLNPGTGEVKDVGEYSEGERLSAINQIMDSNKKAIAENKALPSETQSLVRELQKDTDKEGTLPPEMTGDDGNKGGTDGIPADSSTVTGRGYKKGNSNS